MRHKTQPLLRIIPFLRKKIDFRLLNLMGPWQSLREPQDIIFCRNVIIYFDKADQLSIIRKLSASLRPGGYLFLGHSESLFNFKTDFVAIRPTIYRKIK
jgi:chemotaxis protein methyltransferase CheR